MEQVRENQGEETRVKDKAWDGSRNCGCKGKGKGPGIYISMACKAPLKHGHLLAVHQNYGKQSSQFTIQIMWIFWRSSSESFTYLYVSNTCNEFMVLHDT
ncbi:unnamed protein product [Arctia plantaginis]|uniref:Uncharacterized protein n=1 Tax=Arctia plantaginis TaxID=874455 RepID=A0A8S1AWJ8_ARCPL|nr:unnamed protein product [Arctia plantaginis]